MSDHGNPALQALPDNMAELQVVLLLRWEDISSLGREASRLAAKRNGPVSLAEAASHRLRTWSAVSNGGSEEKTEPARQIPAITAPQGPEMRAPFRAAGAGGETPPPLAPQGPGGVSQARIPAAVDDGRAGHR
ncbi:hypothetical protein ACFYYR_25330 [Streptomyces sp. NPDC001922]|uniref:hypothetical protein n=1 Tax=Streptomyces sp. NPDC001922 TaxID=3364624 RepID=UPI00368EBD49